MPWAAPHPCTVRIKLEGQHGHEHGAVEAGVRRTALAALRPAQPDHTPDEVVARRIAFGDVLAGPEFRFRYRHRVTPRAATPCETFR